MFLSDDNNKMDYLINFIGFCKRNRFLRPIIISILIIYVVIQFKSDLSVISIGINAIRSLPGILSTIFIFIFVIWFVFYRK